MGLYFVFSSNFISVQDLEGKLHLKLDGLNKKMQTSFNSFESNLMMHTDLIMTEIQSFEQTLGGKLDSIICNIQRFDIYPSLRTLQSILDSYSSSSAVEKRLRLKDSLGTYRTQFQDIFGNHNSLFNTLVDKNISSEGNFEGP